MGRIFLSFDSVQRGMEMKISTGYGALQATQAATAQAATAQGEPASPAPPHPITIHGSNGQTTVIDLPAGFSARNVIPPQAVDISLAFFLTMAFIIVGLPIARAFARGMDRRGTG